MSVEDLFIFLFQGGQIYVGHDLSMPVFTKCTYTPWLKMKDIGGQQWSDIDCITEDIITSLEREFTVELVKESYDI